MEGLRGDDSTTRLAPSVTTWTANCSRFCHRAASAVAVMAGANWLSARIVRAAAVSFTARVLLYSRQFPPPLDPSSTRDDRRGCI